MINRQLIDHIKGQINQGVSPDVIRSSLVSMGWKEKDLKEAFDSLVPTPPAVDDSKPKLKKSHVIILLAAFLFIGLVFVFKKPYTPAVSQPEPAVVENNEPAALPASDILEDSGFYPMAEAGKITISGLEVSDFKIGVVNGSDTFFCSVKNITEDIILLDVENVYTELYDADKNLIHSEKLSLPLELGSQKGSSFSWVSGGSLTGGAYVRITKRRPSSDNDTVAVEEFPAMSAKDSYMKMKLESDDIKNWADFEVYVAKYGSKERLADLASKKNQLDSLPGSVKDQLALFAKIPPSNEIVNIKESIKGSVATLNVQTIKSTYTGVVTMVFEDGRWKLNLEAWQEKAE